MRDLEYLKEIVTQNNQWMLYGDESIELLISNDKDDFDKIGYAQLFFLHITLLLVPLSKIFFLYFSQVSLSLSRKKKYTQTSHYVAELERSYRHKNYFKHINPSNEIQYEMIKIFERKEYTKLRYLPLNNILKHAYKNYKNIFLFLRFKHNKKLLRTITKNVVTNIATYSYFCAMFQNIKDSDVAPNYYNSGGDDLSTYASIQEGISTHFLAHGLLSFVPNILYPHFTSCMVYSQIEADVILETVEGVEVSLYPIEKISQQDKTIIIYLDYEKDFATSKMGNTLLSIVQFFIRHDHEVYIKPHPDSDGVFMDEFIRTNKCKLLRSDEDSTDLVLKKIKASFVAGWGSTTECEALRSGVLPINLLTERLQNHHKYPFYEASLNWPKDQEKIKNIINSSDEYIKTLSEFTQRIT